MEPAFVARHILGAGKKFTIVPSWKWKIVYRILKTLPRASLAKLHN